MWKVVLLAFLTLFATCSSAESFSLAYSKKLGVEVLADGGQSSWCKSTPQLTLVAEDKVFFEKSTASLLLGKIGKGVVEKKCPQAKLLIVEGKVKNKASVVWSGQAKKSASWLFEKTKLAAPQIATNKVAKEKEVVKESTKKETASTAKAIPTAVTTNSFSVAGWEPLASPGVKIAAGVNFIPLYNKSRSCKVRLNRKLSFRKGVEVYYEQNADSEAVCINGFLNGDGSITLYSKSKGYKERRLFHINAWFIEGVAVSGDPLKKPLLERFNLATGEELIAYYLGADVSSKVFFIGELKRNGNEWNSCSRVVRVSLITDNEQIFEEEKKDIESLTVAALNNVLAVCPEMKRLDVVAKRTLKAAGRSNKDVFYEVKLRKQGDGTWEPVGRAVNYSLSRLQEKQRQEKIAEYRRWKQANGAYRQIESFDTNARVAFLHGVSRIDNPLRLFLIKQGREQEVSGNLFVRVSEVDGDEALTDWPVEIKLTNALDQINEEGWYVLTGSIELEEEQELVRHGFPKAIVDVSKVTACQEKACGEVKDATSLIRARFDLPEWEPGKQPASPY